MRILLIVCVLLLTFGMAAGEEYYCTIYAYDSPKPNPRYAHTWAVFTKTDNDKSETITISWEPAGGNYRILQKRQMGRNSLSILNSGGPPRIITSFGPYKTNEFYFLKAKERVNQLNHYSFKALDNRPGTLNCIHAVSNFSGGHLDTGNASGAAASQMIVNYFKTRGIIE